ncbi:MAG: hypothetical protein ACE5J9_03810 [Methanosarcinales archaeon]
MGIIAILVVTATSPPSLEDQSVNPQVWQYVYSAKFVCGYSNTTGLAAPVVPGTYATAINVHNPWYFTVNLTKKVAQAPREVEKPIPPSKPITYNLQPDYAFEIDCEDIYKIGNIPNTQPFAKGFVVLTSPRPLDVIAVYTGADSKTNSLQTLEVETLIRPIRVPVPVVTPTPTPK